MGLKILSQPLLNLSDSLMKLLHKTVISVFGGHIVISVCLAVCESCAGKLTLLSSFHQRLTVNKAASCDVFLSQPRRELTLTSSQQPALQHNTNTANYLHIHIINHIHYLYSESRRSHSLAPIRAHVETLSHTLILFTVFSVSNYFFTPLFLASSPPYPALTLPCAPSLSFNSSHFTHPLHSFIFSPSPSHPCGDSIWRSDYEGH